MTAKSKESVKNSILGWFTWLSMLWSMIPYYNLVVVVEVAIRIWQAQAEGKMTMYFFVYLSKGKNSTDRFN